VPAPASRLNGILTQRRQYVHRFRILSVQIGGALIDLIGNATSQEVQHMRLVLDNIAREVACMSRVVFAMNSLGELYSSTDLEAKKALLKIRKNINYN
jgi:hypothetical protein